MTITTYRIFRNEHARNWFDGRGSYLFGGRWNSPGRRVVYSAATLSLATLEMLVYIYDQTMVGEYSWASVAFGEDMVERVEVAQLPRDWRSDGTFRSLRAIGDQWALANRSAVLRVPSAIIPMEYNFVINPSHTDSTRIELGQVQDFVLDPRLLRK